MPDETDAKILTASPLEKLEETTRTPSYYVDEDHPAYYVSETDIIL